MEALFAHPCGLWKSNTQEVWTGDIAREPRDLLGGEGYNSDAFCSEVQCFSGKEVALTEINDQEKIPESCERKFTLRMRASEQRIGT